MIGCTTLERHIVPASMTSPLQRLAGAGTTPFEPQFVDVRADETKEIDPRVLFLYVDVRTDTISDEVWYSIQYQLHKHAHAILYVMPYQIEPSEKFYPRFKQLALFPLSVIDDECPTYVAFTPAPEGSRHHIVLSTYSIRPMIVPSAL